MRDAARFTALAVWLLVAPAAACAQEAAPAPGIALSGMGVAVSRLTPESLADLPPVAMDVSFMTSKGEEKGHYDGVLLWDVLKRTRLLEGIEHNAELRRTFDVAGSDGYVIAFSVGELAANFGDTPAMIALKVDGKPLGPANLRLIVPGDKRGARNVRDVASITFH
jgi:hypothetical protein